MTIHCSAIVKWFCDNLLKLNDERYHIMVFGDKSTATAIKRGSSEIKESDYAKLLEITFDKKLSSIKRIEDLCRNDNQKIHLACQIY